MKVELRFFADVREALGVANECVDVPDSVSSFGDLRAWLRMRGGAWVETFAEGRSLRMACNHEMTDPSRRITESCEVVFFPPVTGG
ncbi:MAG: Molybdopterin synthase sulfur carrier subunit [Candidatus Burkholderia crenata]|nr:MAG: Molybdopterin synthase sulfur carrier subunit [Candidatus Burkholderia crenata]